MKLCQINVQLDHQSGIAMETLIPDDATIVHIQRSVLENWVSIIYAIPSTE